MIMVKVAVSASFLVALCAFTAPAAAYSTSKEQSITSPGQQIQLTFSGLPQVSSGDVTVTVILDGDFDLPDENAQVTIDGEGQTPHVGGQLCLPVPNDYVVDAATVSDGVLNVDVQLSNTVDVQGGACNDQVTVVVSYATDLVDLRPHTLQLQPPLPQRSGQSISLDYVLANDGGTDFNGSVSMRYWHCLAETPDDCQSLGTANISSLSIAAGASTPVSWSGTVPVTAPPGTSYVRVEVDYPGNVDEDDETNNDGYGAMSLSTLPDLSFYPSSSYTRVDTPVDGAGEPITVRVRIENAASTTAVRDPFDLLYSYCPDSSLSNCVELGRETVSDSINSGAYVNVLSTGLVAPVGLVAGVEQYVVVEIDPDQVLAESATENNTVSLPFTPSYGTPDHVIDALAVSYTQQHLEYEVVVCNVGDRHSQSQLVLGLYYDRSTAPGCDTPVDQSKVVTLVSSTQCRTTSFVRHNVPVGSYRSWVRIDANCLAAESDETNNDRSQTIFVFDPFADGGVVIPDAGADAAEPDGGTDVGVDGVADAPADVDGGADVGGDVGGDVDDGGGGCCATAGATTTPAGLAGRSPVLLVLALLWMVRRRRR